MKRVVKSENDSVDSWSKSWVESGESDREQHH